MTIPKLKDITPSTPKIEPMIVGNPFIPLPSKKTTKYPKLVSSLVNCCDAWIIGSACVVETPRDYDIFVPIKHWKTASALIPTDAKINRLGGFKCLCEDYEVDVWTGFMHDILASAYFYVAFHPQTGVLIRKDKTCQEEK